MRQVVCTSQSRLKCSIFILFGQDCLILRNRQRQIKVAYFYCSILKMINIPPFRSLNGDSKQLVLFAIF